MASSNVRLFALSTCSHCKSVKEILNSRDIEHECVEVDRLDGEARKEALAELKKHNSRLTFPTLVVGDNVVVGHKTEEINAVLQSAEKESRF
jgi:glutaredoxin-like protein NrdH